MSSLPSLSFGALLRRYRQAAGLTQEELAERAHLSRGAIDTLERGTRRAPRKETLALLAEALALSASERVMLETAARQSGLAVSPTPARGAIVQPGSGAAWPLVGRAHELAGLKQHMEGTGPPVLLLAGEPGIGKSRLLREATRLASERGWTVLEGGCQRRSGQEPFAPLVGALEGYIRRAPPGRLRSDLDGCAWLARLLPELAEATLVPAPSWTLPPEQERRLMFAAVSRFLANIAGPVGTLLVLDDLQWAGEDALDLLTMLVRSPTSAPLRVLGAYRTTEVRPPDPLGVTLADLGTAGLARQQRLGPLIRQEASDLLQHILAGGEHPGAEQVEKVLMRTGGVPFFLVSCAEALRGGTLASEHEAVPWTVAQSIRQRAAALPLAAQELLGVGAVIGRQIERAVLVAACTSSGQDERAMVGALEEVGQARLLVETGEDHYHFPHDLIREVVLADLSAARRASLHRQVAEVLEAIPGEPPTERLAHHYTRAGVGEKAIFYLERAGDQAAAMYAHAEAERYYRELLAWAERLGQSLKAAHAREKLGVVLTSSGQYNRAVEMLGEAVDFYHTSNDLSGLGRATGQLMFAFASIGTPEYYSEHLQPLLERLEAYGPSASLAELYAGLAMYCLVIGRRRDMLPLTERAVEIARAVGDARSLAYAQAAHGYSLLFAGFSLEALHLAEQLLPLAQTAGQPVPLIEALQIGLMVHVLSGNFATARHYAAQALEVSQRWGEPAFIAFEEAYSGQVAFFSGAWDEADAHLERSIALGRQTGFPRAVQYPLIELGRLRLAQGAREEACQYLDEGIHNAEQRGELIAVWPAQSLRAESELVEGRPVAARARLLPLLEGRSMKEMQLQFVIPVLAWAQIELGEIEAAQGLLTELEVCLRARNERVTLVDILWVSARLWMRQERWAEAQAALEEALGLCRAMLYPYGEAKALYVYGQLHQAKGEAALARERLEEALAILNRLGERLYAAHVQEALAMLNY